MRQLLDYYDPNALFPKNCSSLNAEIHLKKMLNKYLRCIRKKFCLATTAETPVQEYF
jgi:hypothetical protein